MQTALNITIPVIEALTDWARDIIESHGWTILFVVAPTSIAAALLAGFIF